ncbi:MAG: uracil-DNA glycosylase [Bacillota bacterium]
MEEDKNINCMKCKYFFVTWEPDNPRGCSYFGFKTKLMPSALVQKSSGKKCGAFANKDK